MTLSDEAVATLVNRTKQAVYCKRWGMKLYGKKAKARKAVIPAESQSITQKVIKDTINNSVERIVLGNVTIDLVSKTLTVHF